MNKKNNFGIILNYCFLFYIKILFWKKLLFIYLLIKIGHFINKEDNFTYEGEWL